MQQFLSIFIKNPMIVLNIWQSHFLYFPQKYENLCNKRWASGSIFVSYLPPGGGGAIFSQIATVISSTLSTFWCFVVIFLQSKIGYNWGFSPHSFFLNFFSNRAYNILCFFDFLADNQAGLDKNHTWFSAIKVGKMLDIIGAIWENIDFQGRGVLSICGTVIKII